MYLLTIICETFWV